MAASFMKGALISFMPTFIGSLPNVIVFQYNPETITHTWMAVADPSKATDAKSAVDPTAVDRVPGETFAFKLYLDATDMIADGNANVVAAGLAKVSGVYTRLAALEMLQYPMDSSAGAGLLGSVSSAISSAASSLPGGGSAPSTTVPSFDVPTALFVWGPQRIVPVRVTELAITETLYDGLLNPTHAEVSITLQVLTPSEIRGMTGETQQVAQVAYVYTQGLRQAQVLANLGDAAASIIGMLPNPF